MYQRTLNIAYVLYNDRSPASTADYALYYGKIDYVNKKIDSIPIVNHHPDNTYYGALFIHNAKFYYWGETSSLKTSSTFNFNRIVGFLTLFD